MKNLIKYSSADNLTITDDNQINNDTRVPYSFSEWIKRSVGVAVNEEIVQYNIYLQDWYKNRDLEKQDLSIKVKNSYISLLQQINLTVLTPEEKKWTQNIDWNNDLEISQVIPFYARKLKEIAIYLANKREAIKRAKLKYNLAGTSTSLEKLLYEYLLKAFTKKQFPGNEYITNITDVSILSALPNLIEVTPDFDIEIEELYDDTVYFDKDPTISSNMYYNLTNENIALMLSSFNESELEWLYNTGSIPLCADNPLIFALNDVYAIYDTLPLSAKNTFDGDIIEHINVLLTEKYIGTEQYIISGGYYIPWEKYINIPLNKGNNWFYWTSGEYLYDSQFEQVDNILLSETSLVSSGATADSNYLSADKIFITCNNQVSGAWLKKNNYSNYVQVMSAKLFNGDNIFSFPFPGYGISGVDVEWTGRNYSNINDGYKFLEENIQDSIKSVYWQTKLDSKYSITPIYIYNTSVIDCSASAGTTYKTSDKIIVRSSVYDSNVNGIYNGKQEYAWLYKMVYTDIPITYGENKIYWPFDRVLDSISMVASSNQCLPVALSSINIGSYFKGAVAGNNIENSDILKKVSSLNGNIIEMAWLSGKNLSTPTFSTTQKLLSGVSQPSLSFTAMPGTENTFIWESLSAVYADNIFKYIPHKENCEYLNLDLISLYKEIPSQNKTEIDYNQWNKCNCKSILHTPLGHPGSIYDDYNRMSDFIVLIEDPNDTFNLNDWRDSLGRSYKNSTAFGWYKLNANGLEPDVGWSAGNWVTNLGTPFILSANRLYMYYRSDLNRNTNIDENDLSSPYYILNYSYNNNNQKWIKCYNNNDVWTSENITSDMIIHPGDYLIYDHQNTLSYILTSCSCSFCPSTTTIGTSTIYSAPSAINNEYKLNTINFMLNIPLSGWNYNTNKWDGISLGARPYWAKATDEVVQDNKYKLIDIWGGYPIEVDYYNFKYQPAISEIKLDADNYIQYISVNNNVINWIQPIQVKEKDEWNEWCNINIEYNNISSNLVDAFDSLKVSATNTPSELVLYTNKYNPVLINYYSQNSFNWNQLLTNTTLGVPPTGGVWIPITSEKLIIPSTPYTNLLNRHYPTFATLPYIGNLYTEKFVGGYFLPQYIGLTQAINKNKVWQLETRGIVSTYNDKRGIDNVYKNPDVFSTDIGLTKSTQYAAISSIEYNSVWMKSSVSEQYKSGMIVNTRDHQTFCPYQTKYETIKYNNNGIRRQEDNYTPWSGTEDNTWDNIVDWPASWRGQYPIEQWYEQNDISDKQIYQWKTDIFGNQYALYKDISNLSIYEKYLRYGEIWIRDARNKILLGRYSLSNIYDKFYSITTEPYPSQGSVEYNVLSALRDFDIWYDTIMLYTSGYLLINKIEFDYDENLIYALSDNLNYICLGNRRLFGDVWFNEVEKYTTICCIVSAENYYYPELYMLDLNKNTLNKIYNGVNDFSNTIEFREVEEPVLTYNADKFIYNVSFIGYGFSESNTLSSGMILSTIDIKNNGTSYDLVSATYLTPTYIETDITY